MVSMSAWRLGRDISGDEQMIGVQGRHADKLCITYKVEGDGFQCDDWQMQDLLGHFTSTINRHQKSGQCLGILRCIPYSGNV